MHARTHARAGSEDLLLSKSDLEGLAPASEVVGGVRRFIDISVPRNIGANVNELAGAAQVGVCGRGHVQSSSADAQRSSKVMVQCPVHALEKGLLLCKTQGSEQDVPALHQQPCALPSQVFNVDDLKEVVAGNKEARQQVGARASGRSSGCCSCQGRRRG